MVIKSSLLVGVLCTLTFHSFTWAAEEKFDGNELIKLCNVSELSCMFFSQGIVSGFTWGAARMATHLGTKTLEDAALMADEVIPFCIAKNVTRQQISAVVLKYMSDFPESRHFGADILVLLALKKAFPCV